MNLGTIVYTIIIYHFSRHFSTLGFKLFLKILHISASLLWWNSLNHLLWIHYNDWSTKSLSFKEHLTGIMHFSVDLKAAFKTLHYQLTEPGGIVDYASLICHGIWLRFGETRHVLDYSLLLLLCFIIHFFPFIFPFYSILSKVRELLLNCFIVLFTTLSFLPSCS